MHFVIFLSFPEIPVNDVNSWLSCQVSINQEIGNLNPDFSKQMHTFLSTARQDGTYILQRI